MVLQGDNAQGKTNLLEAIYLLATAKSHRATAEREMINWVTPSEELGIARLLAQVQKGSGSLRVEIAFVEAYHSPEEASHVQKRIRINGVPRRAIDLVGQVNWDLLLHIAIPIQVGHIGRHQRVAPGILAR